MSELFHCVIPSLTMKDLRNLLQNTIIQTVLFAIFVARRNCT